MSGIIFLIGMSGAGKTAWGSEIAKAYALPFHDIDHWIESQQQLTIAQLFSLHGEAGFRLMEDKALREIVHKNKPPFIVSCGGGTPVRAENLQFMKEHGCVVYLKASIETILENLNGQIAERPMLNNGVINPTQRLKELYEKRKKIYEQADHSFQVEHFSVEQMQDIIEAIR